jgi:hypothetical protein
MENVLFEFTGPEHLHVDLFLEYAQQGETGRVKYGGIFEWRYFEIT